MWRFLSLLWQRAKLAKCLLITNLLLLLKCQYQFAHHKTQSVSTTKTSKTCRWTLPSVSAVKRLKLIKDASWFTFTPSASFLESNWFEKALRRKDKFHSQTFPVEEHLLVEQEPSEKHFNIKHFLFLGLMDWTFIGLRSWKKRRRKRKTAWKKQD